MFSPWRSEEMIKAILFDFDGVIVPIDAEIKRQMKQMIINQLSVSAVMTREQARKRVERALKESEYDEEYFKLQDAAIKTGSHDKSTINSLFHALSRRRLPRIQKKIVGMLCNLRKRALTLGIVTLSSNERIEQILKDTGIREYFCFVESAAGEFQKDFRSEWKKAAYKDFLDKYSLQGYEVLCVGDSFSIDLQPAIDLGMQTALIVDNCHAEIQQQQKSLANYTLPRNMLPSILMALSKKQLRRPLRTLATEF